MGQERSGVLNEIDTGPRQKWDILCNQEKRHFFIFWFSSTLQLQLYPSLSVDTLQLLKQW